jgi:LL-diaminopimelate aminotransferase
MRVNENFGELKDSYLFSTVSKKVAAYAAAHPGAEILRMGIGDVTRPLCPAVVDALHRAVAEMGTPEGFHGYIPSEQGYGFLREAVAGYYGRRGVTLSAEEIFISDGAKSDLGNILDLFSTENTVLVPDPVYPVYVDTNVMAGRRILYLAATKKNGFLPLPDASVHADILYLCSPNNPTGAVYDKAGLQAWVDYALREGAVLLFDAAYEAFVSDPALPRSIYEIEGAKECAIEFCSLSKTAGFTGTRCGYTVVPLALQAGGLSLNRCWGRRQSTKFNGVPYIVQRAAEAVFTEEGYAQCMESIDYYRGNARIMAETLDRLGLFYTGGVNSPYLWLRCPGGLSSWDFFDLLLERAQVVGTPGAGFGRNGEGFFRLTAFGQRETTREAMRRFERLAREL